MLPVPALPPLALAPPLPLPLLPLSMGRGGVGEPPPEQAMALANNAALPKHANVRRIEPWPVT